MTSTIKSSSCILTSVLMILLIFDSSTIRTKRNFLILCSFFETLQSGANSIVLGIKNKTHKF
ncbi:hypothetical protein BpHYR1_006404 [Brachionus plicatilis]|uniref:Uncharacterized protein n=1 Tax=Brachionus plicatilis TaxID=10195 RepID=A0A3M7SHI4_BRAPC|nr:hypothetical protein BpHYR1_006404 [Brachionus plicatilis]